MSYIDLINRFWQCDVEFAFTPSDTRLFFYLLDTCNKLRWKQTFGHSDRHLSLRLGMSVNTVREAKNRLKQRGLIDFETPSKNKRGRGVDGQTKYRIMETVSEFDTVPDTNRRQKKEDRRQKTELPDGNSSGVVSFQPTNKTRACVKQVSQFDTAKYGAFEPAIRRWLEYKAEIKDAYKSQQSVDTMARNLWKLAREKPTIAMQIVEQSIGNNWKGLFELKNGNEHAGGTSKNTNSGFSDEYKADILRRMGAV